MEKEARYEDLVADCKKAGWRTHLFAVEVGARGYASQSLLTLLNKLGIQRRSSKRMITNISDCPEMLVLDMAEENRRGMDKQN